MFHNKVYSLITFILIFSIMQLDGVTELLKTLQSSEDLSVLLGNPQHTTYDIAPAGFIKETTSGINPSTTDNYINSVAETYGQYQPIGEIVVPTGEQLVTRAVEEKDGYAYLLTRSWPEMSYIYTYDVSELPNRTDFTTYNSPVSSQQMSNGNGLLRNGEYLYAYGYGGLSVLSIKNPASPILISTRFDLVIFNLVQYNNYLIAPGLGGVAIYSVSNPSHPVLLSIYRVANKYFYSAAVYNDTIYTSEFEVHSSGSTYTYGFRVINFTNPTNPYLERLMDNSGVAFHMKVVGDKLIECAESNGPYSNYVSLWNLNTPTNPVFQTSKSVYPGSTRACALDGNNIVVNGSAFRVYNNTLENVATFEGGFLEVDGFPYGSAVSSEFVFIAQSPRILVLKKIDPVVNEARLDIGMPYPPTPYHRGCSSDFVGCGGPFHGFYQGVCTDLALDAYNFGSPFNIQGALSQDYLVHPGRYRWGSARNSEDMRRFFIYNQQFLPNSQPYQAGDIAFFDWNGDGLTDHVNIISAADANGRPLRMVDATGVYPGNPSGLAFEHDWSGYYDQHVQGHGRLIGGLNQSSPSEILQTLRITLNSPFVKLSLSDSNGKTTSETYDESLVASNVEAYIPYIPGGVYTKTGSTQAITIYQPLANSTQYTLEMNGQQNSSFNYLIETSQNGVVTDSRLFTQTVTAGGTYLANIALNAPGGTIDFTAAPPVPAPKINLPQELSLSGLVGTSAQASFTLAEVSGDQPVDNASVTVTDLLGQMGGTVPGENFISKPISFTVPAGGNQQLNLSIKLNKLPPGVYQGSLILTTQNAGTYMIPLTLDIGFKESYLPLIQRR